MKNDKHSGNSRSFDITKFSFDDNHDESCTVAFVIILISIKMSEIIMFNKRK